MSRIIRIMDMITDIGGRIPEPSEVVGYLLSENWRRVHLVSGRSSVWLDPSGVHEVFVPLRSEGSDYSSLLLDLLMTIARKENRAVNAVADDIRTTSADVVRVRRIGTEDDLLPLDLGARFFGTAASVMVAAACAAYDPRASYGPRKASDVIDFTRQAGFDRTEKGSFVVKIVCPLETRIQSAQTSLEGLDAPLPPAPFARKTTEMLVQALEAARSAAANAIADGDLQSFVEAVDKGVSANLCAALGEMSTDRSLKEVEVNVSWARNWPRQPGADRVSVSRELLTVMSHGAARLADVNEREDYELVGPVVRTQSETGAGEIRINTLLDGRPRKVSMNLNAEDYNRAVHAHAERDTGVVVRCIGNLVKEGRRYRLLGPRRFEVLTPDDDTE
ncbi:MAG: hypothetical protein AAGF11_16925 [Myxococcota bacterium]